MATLDQAHSTTSIDRSIWRLSVATVLTTSLALVIVGLLVVWNAFHFVAADMRDKASEEMLAAVTLRGEQIENYIAERRGDGSILSSRRSVRGLLDPTTPDAERREYDTLTRNTIRQFRKQYHYRQIQLFDGDLNNIARRSASLVAQSDGSAGGCFH